jgi:hypothetical protein
MGEHVHGQVDGAVPGQFLGNLGGDAALRQQVMYEGLSAWKSTTRSRSSR